MKVRQIFAEYLGTLFLLLAVVGSGIMGEKLSGGNVAIALLANAIATGAGLFVLISIFGPISGAHFNPSVSTYFRLKGDLKSSTWLYYVSAQFAGAFSGVVLAHFIFELPLLQTSVHLRNGWPQIISEFVATTGLLFAIVGFVRFHPSKTALGVASYIVGAYWFTASTSFANPAVTVARSLTNTFSGIAPESIVGYICAQMMAVIIFSAVDRNVFLESEKGN